MFAGHRWLRNFVAGVSDPGSRTNGPASLRPATARKRLAHGHRRGVLLLVVLSMLVLFVLLGLTFVLVAARYRSNTINGLKSGIRTTSPRKQLDDAAMVLFRGTTNRLCSIGPYSLLEDMYGADGLVNQSITSAASQVARGQLLDLPYAGRTDGYYNGDVLTFIDGPAAGKSTRVVGAGSGVLRVMAFEDGIQPGSTGGRDRFILNGRPFNGTGLGYSVNTHRITTQFDPAKFSVSGTSPHPLYSVYLPNARNSLLWDDYVASTMTQPQEYGPGIFGPDRTRGGSDDVGLDEDYDAADLQNLHLAFIPSITTLTSRSIIPSFHRPELFNYWQGKFGGISSIPPDVLRAASFRPIVADHPNFTGSNPNFDPLSGPWDVDNDANGVTDSVWVDLGYPAQAGADGRMYKPLFAILCIDLDGRLNVNVHGSLRHTQTQTLTGAFADNSATGAPPEGRGLGFGVADINFNATTALQAVFPQSEYDDLLKKRYSSTASPTETVPGKSGADLLSQAQHFELPAPAATSIDDSSYAWPPDFYGRGAIGLDLAGQPLMLDAFRGGDSQNHPYEMNVSRRAVRDSAGIDSPFTPAELERVLRPYDIDTASLPSRLKDTLRTASPQLLQRLLTTDSFDLPCPGLAVPREMMLAPSGTNPRPTNSFRQLTGVDPGHVRLVDIYQWKLLNGGCPPGSIATTLQQIFPYELSAGLRFDINRPFGNGRKDTSDGNNVVDEPEEALRGETFWDNVFPHASGNKVDFDHDNDGVVSGDTDANMARQNFARHLYCLLMLLKGNAEIEFDGIAGTSPAETARGLAQWAVNVVDFRDADSTMTVFPYDENPWDGWNPPSPPFDFTAPAQPWVVIGCERPQLLLTETFAYHDRRTKDTATSGMLKRAAPPDDLDYDQPSVPIGRLYIELFNPGAIGGLAINQGVNLATETPGNTAVGRCPVWRIAITKSGDQSVANAIVLKSGDIDRKVYFTDPKTTAADDPETPSTYNSFYREASSPVPVAVQPQQYVLLGPATTTDIYGYQAGTSSPKRIDINTTIDGVADIRAHVAVVIDQVLGNYSQRPLNASEPTPGTSPAQYDRYWGTAATGRPSDGSLPWGTDSTPWDYGAGGVSGSDPTLAQDGTTPNYKVAILQRLANPYADWDPSTNPYVVIDSLPIDLTAYTSETVPPTTPDPEFVAANGTFNFGTRERGTATVPNGPVVNLWGKSSTSSSSGLAPPQIGYKIAGKQNETLGFLNKAFEGAARTASASPVGRHDSATIGAAHSQYYGAPTKPFPWITWNDRPYANVGELLLVPHSSPARLLADTETATVNSSPYDDARGPFGHLLNLLHSPTSGGQDGEHLYRLFEYVRVPSRFAGTETFLSAPDFVGTTNSGTENLHPPFSRVSEYRDPGRVNINTISDSRIWDAILAGVDNNRAGSSPSWITHVQPSIGYDPNVTPPTFPRPFRSPGGAVLTLPEIPEPREVDVTLYRSNGTQPLLFFNSNNASDDPSRNAYFQYQNMQRLTDRLTTRSNVYAVWITVGYFEVTSRATDATHPDGCELGAEIGSDTGDIKRHRAFYIFDRSIPVGYERGQDHNVDDAILVKRFIE